MIITENYWRSKNGNLTKVEELGEEHLNNIISYLERKIDDVEHQMRDYSIGNQGEYEKLKETKMRFEEELKIMKKEKNRRIKEFVQSKSEKGDHRSSMSPSQRKMITDSLCFTFNYPVARLARMTDPELYDTWKNETEKVEI